MSAPRRLFDLLLALVLGVLAQLECWLGSFEQRPLLSAVLALMTFPLAWRRIRPLLVGFVVLPAFAAGQALQGDVTELATGALPVLVVTYTVAAYEPIRRALVGGGLAVVAAMASVLASPEGPTPDDFVYAGLLVTVAWSVGRVLSSRHEQLDVLAEQNRSLEREQAAATAAAVRLERARIARELHDVVAHGVSVMVLQAGGASEVVRTRPDEVAAALQHIQTTGRAALVELRRMLDLLRDGDGAGDPGLRPPPGLPELAELVEGMRAAGLAIRLTVDEGLAVPVAVGLSAYRIVQEALTNTLKHAGPVAAEVAVSLRGTELEIEVRDDGTAAASGLPGAGQGLAGMRERVSIFGGRLDIDTEDGFRIRARLPVAEPT